MNFDPTRKAVLTTPATETWIIRDQGYNLRVSPLTAEMVMLRSEDLESSFFFRSLRTDARRASL
jgi:hypothetical protein